jgi:hypothetical protein
MSDDTCYTENYRPSCELVGSGGALSELGYMKTDSNEIVEIEPNVQQYECDKFWTTLDDITPNSSSVFLSEKYLNDPRAVPSSYYNNDGDESNRRLAVKCMARGGGGEDSGCMSPLNYFDEIPNLPEDPQEKMETWEQLFTSMREQFLDPNICQRTESIGPTNENQVMTCRREICEDGMVLKSNPELEIGQSPTSDLCCEPAVCEESICEDGMVLKSNPELENGQSPTSELCCDPADADATTNPDTTNPGQRTERVETVTEEVTQDNTCHIGHILQIVTDINSRITDTENQISNTCSNGDTLNSGETCYLYCNSFESAGPTPTTEELDGARIGTEANPSKSSKISCGSVSTGQELNCGPDDSRIEGDICPHTHHIYLKCSEESDEIEIDFEIDAQTATGGALLGTALAVASYLIFL